MSFSDIIKKSVLEGFSAGVPTGQTLVILSITFAISIYIFFVYRIINRSSLYDKRFHISISVLSVITAGIIIAMQSSIVISLGMVGALSIVRFRTAIKDALDLVFLFWSIGIGIICGARLFELAVFVSIIVTVALIVLEFLPINKKPYMLIVNSKAVFDENEIFAVLGKLEVKYKVLSRNIKKNGADYILEVETKKEKELLTELSSNNNIEYVSLLDHEGELRI